MQKMFREPLTRICCALVLGVCVVAGCREPNAASTSPQSTQTEAEVPSPPQPASYAMTNAQPKLATIKVWLGAQEIDAEVATSMVQIATGMMFRKEMAEKEGMLFVFSRPHQTAFYMRNTYIPLSCAYINPEGEILEIHDMKPLDEAAIPAKSSDIQYVLEVKQGWFARNNVSVGTVLRTEMGSLRDTFFRRARQ